MSDSSGAGYASGPKSGICTDGNTDKLIRDSVVSVRSPSAQDQRNPESARLHTQPRIISQPSGQAAAPGLIPGERHKNTSMLMLRLGGLETT